MISPSARRSFQRIRQSALELADAAEQRPGDEHVRKVLAGIPDQDWPILVAAVRYPYNDELIWEML